MPNKFKDEVLPKLAALKHKMDHNQDLSGNEISELKKAIDDMSSEPMPSRADLIGAQTDCAICLACGFFNPSALAFAAAAAG